MNEYNDYEDLGDIELPEDEAKMYNQMIEVAEKQNEDVRISFRWKSKQLDLLKQASELIGIPYQTYIKTVLFKQSLEDIKKAKETLAI